MSEETVTITIQTDEETDELTIPADLAQLLSDAEESVPEVVGNIAMIGMAQRIHGPVHHSEADPSDEVVALEEHTMELFEERFGASFQELTGHSHD